MKFNNLIRFTPLFIAIVLLGIPSSPINTHNEVNLDESGTLTYIIIYKPKNQVVAGFFKKENAIKYVGTNNLEYSIEKLYIDE